MVRTLLATLLVTLLAAPGCRARLGAGIADPEVEQAMLVEMDGRLEFFRRFKGWQDDQGWSQPDIRRANASCARGLRDARRSIRAGVLTTNCEPIPPVCQQALVEAYGRRGAAAADHLCYRFDALEPMRDACHFFALRAERDRRLGPGVYEARRKARCRAMLEQR
ncbi:MAG: hypothetical protein AAF721_00105 [Myxococcota bacterium]